MIKIVGLAALSMISAATAYAGTVVFVAPAAPMMVEEQGSMGGSGAWIIPLLAIALIALAISSSTTTPPGTLSK